MLSTSGLTENEECLMTTARRFTQALYDDETGQDLIEYALIAMLVALVAITGLSGLASSITSEYSSITTRFGNAV
jgi:pilus assembly protein Flp/PilA